MSRPQAVRIALAGCGVVGSEFVRLVAGRSASVGDGGPRLEIARVLVRDPEKERAVPLSRHRFTSDVAAFLREPADVLVEAVGGLDPAGPVVRAALDRGIRVVTANKALVAAAGPDLAARAVARGTTFDFEAAVGGGIPVIRVLREGLPGQPVRRIRAILNGTTNYVLTLLERGIAFADALTEARRAGFAEADPTRDLDGTDASDKLRILVWIAWGLAPESLRVRRRGILPDPDRLAADAAAAGGSARLVAECALDEGTVTASVEPVIVAPDGPFGSVLEEQNRVEIDLGWRRPLDLGGPGAGAAPTATALLGDVLRPCGSLPLREESAARASGIDDRDHAWVVSVDGTGRELRDRLDVAGFRPHSIPGADGHERAGIGPCPWSRLEPPLRELEEAGRRPVAARVDLPGWAPAIRGRRTVAAVAGGS